MAWGERMYDTNCMFCRLHDLLTLLQLAAELPLETHELYRVRVLPNSGGSIRLNGG